MKARSKKKIVLLGIMSKIPVAGHVWLIAQYLVGFRRLGWDPYYVEAHGSYPIMFTTKKEDDAWANAAAFVAAVMERFDFKDRWALHAIHEGRFFGMTAGQLSELYRSAALLLNLHGGTLPLPEHAASGRLVYIGTDPVQVEVEVYNNKTETIDALAQHSAFFTWGENYGKPDCQMPLLERFAFKPTRAPVVLDFWRALGVEPGPYFTTIGNWNQDQKHHGIVFRGERYTWSKHYEFLKFLDLPARSGQVFELALSSRSLDEADRRLLEAKSWKVRDALEFSSDLDAYRRYIAQSRGEFTVAKDQNVRLRSGWFSERSAQYLAAGRPVITQETGFSSVLPTGEGLFAFTTMDELLAAVDAVNSAYERHSKGAYALAQDCFSYEVVLKRFLSDVGEPASESAIPHRSVSHMRFSVVINTYNRGPSLRNTLLGLRRQTYDNFEVVVVNGPSTDDTDAVLEEFAAEVRLARCPAVNISKSRNIGIAEAAGNIVAFIDDDGIPAATWLEELAAGYDSERVAGVGGIVYDHTGYALQYGSCVCDRLGNAHFDVPMPLWAYATPKSDRFVHLLGTNASFRRNCLAEIGGFDEEIEYYLDESEVCMRLVDRGYWLRLLEGAPVYHKFLASHLRNDQKVLRKPFPVIKNKFYFSLQASGTGQGVQAILDDGHRFTAKLTKDTHWAHSVGRLKTDELAFFETEVERGVRAGIGRGLTARRQSATIPAANQATFRRFSTLRPKRRLNVCFISQEMPPETLGGIGRFTLDLAQGFAGLGHDVHLITRSPDHNRVDLENGVWIHRLENVSAGPNSFAEHPPTVRKNLSRAAAAHREVQRISQAGPVDLVSAPVWDCEGLFCQMDDSLTSVLTLHTTLKTVVDMNPSWQTSPEMPQLLAMERYLVQTARHLTAPSRNILAKVRCDYGVPGAAANACVIPHGLVDRTPGYQRRRRDQHIRVLFVGRLEVRKGINVLLEAATHLVHEFSQLEFVLVGDDTIPSNTGLTYRAAFEAHHRGDPACQRIRFTGVASETQLYQHYADCDIFCLPARYESFGLVLLEAMMFGKPVVGCAAGGMSEVIEHEANGLLAAPEDPGSLIENLRRLIDSEALRREYGASSRRRYQTEFSADRMVRDTLEAYTRIIDSNLSVSRS